MNKTIITHFYNEEFLLPLWLNHHKQYFDHGILIDYGSTDDSIEIIKEICPSWTIVTSKHNYFDHKLCDEEVQEIENQIDGWRIAIPVTEFVVGTINELLTSTTPTQILLPVVIFTGYQPDGYLDNSNPLWHQVTQGIPPHVDNANRSIHNFRGLTYPPGRHYWLSNDHQVMIFKYSSCLVGPEMIKRRLQIQEKVSASDRKLGVAEHHVYSKMSGLTYDTLKNFYQEHVETKHPHDCSDYIYKMNLAEKPNKNYITSTIINNLPNIEQYTYLELGIGNGQNFKSIKCATKMSVDITPDVATFTGTTDEYFGKLRDTTKFDIIFIDANHDYPYVLRDFNNAIDHANKWILLHDMIPPTEFDSQSAFCSDGYKILYHMLKYTHFEVYPMNNNYGFTLVKLPAQKITLSKETENLSYHDFMNFMMDKKLYSTEEIETVLKTKF